MANFDDFKIAVESLSGGKNTIILDDLGMPSVMVLFPKVKNSELIAGLSETVHPAFMVNGVEKSAIYVSKYQNIVVNDRAYSLPFKDPKASINFDQALTNCRNKGAGWSLVPFSLWAAIALWCKKNGTMPRGNNNYGNDHAYTHEKGVETYFDTSQNKTGRVATGSGPASWNHNWASDGIADLNGNVFEWCAGMRIKDGEIQIIPYANSMLAATDLSATSIEWKAIAADGSLVAPGTAGTLKYGWDGSKLILTTGVTTPVTVEDVQRSTGYTSLGLEAGLTAAELVKALTLYPDTPAGDYGGDQRYINTSGERLPHCGGNWTTGSSAGVFSVNLLIPRSNSNAYIGFRSAFVNL